MKRTNKRLNVTVTTVRPLVVRDLGDRDLDMAAGGGFATYYPRGCTLFQCPTEACPRLA